MSGDALVIQQGAVEDSLRTYAQSFALLLEDNQSPRAAD
jgi:hypothetical protein